MRFQCDFAVKYLELLPVPRLRRPDAAEHHPSVRQNNGLRLGRGGDFLQRVARAQEVHGLVGRSEQPHNSAFDLGNAVVSSKPDSLKW